MSSYSDVLATLAKKYDVDTVAAALLFARPLPSGFQYGLRLEAPNIMKEFTDNVPLGVDPEGTLFFQDIGDLDGTNGYYKVTRVANADVNQCAVWIKFYHHTEDRCYAEFIARDKNDVVDTVGGSGMNGYSAQGLWQVLNVVSASAHVHMHSDDEVVTIDVSALGKTVTIPGATGQFRHGVDVWGNLTFKQLSTLANAAYCDYNNDRIIFYDTYEWSTSISAYFIPVDNAAVGALGINKPNHFQNVKWT